MATTTATLSGSVDPAGLDTTYWFAYGTSATSLSLTTAKLDAGSGSSAVPVSVSVSGLKASRGYTFRLMVSNSSGTTAGALALFTTTAPESASTGQASSVGSTGATLSGNVTPAGLATSYWFEYGTSASKLSKSTAKLAAGSGSGAVPVSVSVSGLKANQSYLFRLMASNSSGISYGGLGLFKTSGTTQSASTGAASAVGSTTATFSGTVSPSGLDTSYWFAYGTSASRLSSTTGKLDAGSGTGQVPVTAAAIRLKPGMTYFFRLVASNASGTSTGAEATFVTSAAAVPAVVTGSASGVLTSIVTLNGSVNPNGSDTKYWFEYGTTSAYGSRTPVLDAGSGTSATQVSATVKGLKSNTAYLFRVVAGNSFGVSAGIGAVSKTAESSCVSDAAAITADAQTLARQSSTVTSATESLAQTQATIAASETPSATTIMQDKATVAQDEATVVADQKALAETMLTAPIGGVVTAVNGSVGATVSGSGSTVSKGAASSATTSGAAGGGAGSGSSSSVASSGSSVFATIDSLGRLEIVSGFPEADATKIAVGQPATVTFAALPGVDVAGKVVAVSGTSTVVSNVVTYDETIALVDPPSGVKEGMTASVSVVDQTRENVLLVASSAITTAGVRSTVELLVGGKTTVTPVTIGLVGNSSTQILSGVKAGDVLVEPTVSITAASSSASTGAGLGGGGGGFGGGGGGGFGGGGGLGGAL
ncbi:MAG TPA: HlyD family efflux transporter periplasmic adaptor subunit [Gaiellaceae bacterium]|nr:HlyD family efflux transporter periplasmic adaptor subunit [Gaiellaceae bacterium]